MSTIFFLISIDETKLKAEIWNAEDFYCEHNVNAIVAWGKLYKKEDFNKIRYPKGKIHEDEFTTYKILFKYGNVAIINQPIYAYFQNPNGIMGVEWTPKNLYQIKAIESCMLYLKNSRYKKALLFCVSHLMREIIDHYNGIKKSSNKELLKQYFPQIQKSMRKTLKIAKKYNLYPMTQYAYYYELAYPTEMKYYWYWQAMKSKIKRK